MAILSFMTKSYAQNVYWYGNRSLENGSVPAEYHQPVKQYAATNFTEDQIKSAVDKGYITEAVYVETMQLKYPGWEMPQPEAPAAELTEAPTTESAAE